jgi:hypothetical protein
MNTPLTTRTVAAKGIDPGVDIDMGAPWMTALRDLVGYVGGTVLVIGGPGNLRRFDHLDRGQVRQHVKGPGRWSHDHARGRGRCSDRWLGDGGCGVVRRIRPLLIRPTPEKGCERDGR